jgi:hypothetical protein
MPVLATAAATSAYDPPPCSKSFGWPTALEDPLAV